MGFSFLIPVVKFALRVVLGEVFSAEKEVGAGNGDEKKSRVIVSSTELLSARFGLDSIAGAIDELKDLIDAVVKVLNSLGLLDEYPGMDIDYGRLIPAAKELFSAVADFVEALSVSPQEG